MKENIVHMPTDPRTGLLSKTEFDSAHRNVRRYLEG
jgi:hypothetical protein